MSILKPLNREGRGNLPPLKSILLRVTAEDKALIARAAQSAGLTVNHWLVIVARAAGEQLGVEEQQS